MASAAVELARYVRHDGTQIQSIEVNRRLASMWFAWSLRPLTWQLPNAWDEFAGDYPTGDGWIKLHTNAPHHKAAALAVLGPVASRDALAAKVATWQADDLEQAVVDAGGCAATLRTQQQWLAHPQGLAVNQEPLLHWQTVGRCDTTPTRSLSNEVNPTSVAQPLAELKVLDLTRVLAGPVAGRFLAGYGAQVLRIDPPDWEEPGVVQEVTLGKRCAGLDLKTPQDRQRFDALLANADVLLHGYRADALETLGYDRARLTRINPQLIDVCLNAFGWSGPWRNRRGFDSLVQMSCGIADHGMRMSNAQRPTPLPVQALDHATGYLLAAATLRALSARREGYVLSAKTSLARVAALLQTTQRTDIGPGISDETGADRAPAIEPTAWGDAQRLRWPIKLSVLSTTTSTDTETIAANWAIPAGALRSSPAQWGDA